MEDISLCLSFSTYTVCLANKRKKILNIKIYCYCHCGMTIKLPSATPACNVGASLKPWSSTSNQLPANGSWKAAQDNANKCLDPGTHMGGPDELVALTWHDHQCWRHSESELADGRMLLLSLTCSCSLFLLYFLFLLLSLYQFQIK